MSNISQTSLEWLNLALVVERENRLLSDLK